MEIKEAQKMKIVEINTCMHNLGKEKHTIIELFLM